jgi:RimJ/RimL family protein N-acetyltransferase
VSRETGLDQFPASETERLRLAVLEFADAEEVRALTDDVRITDAVSFLASPFSLDDARELVRFGRGSRDRLLGMRLRDGGALVGVFGVHLKGGEAVEIGYWVGVGHQGKGYATEAAIGMAALLTELLPDRRIIAECVPGNAASWAVLTKAGFVASGSNGERPGRKQLVLRR